VSTRLSTCYSPHSHVYVESNDNTVAVELHSNHSAVGLATDCVEQEGDNVFLRWEGLEEPTRIALGILEAVQMVMAQREGHPFSAGAGYTMTVEMPARKVVLS
jgi:hypothetical protein